MKNKYNLKFLQIPFEVKASKDTDELIIEGYGAVKNNVDSSNEVITDGAFTKTLKEMGDRVAFCYQHDIRQPVGKIIEIFEDSKGLRIKVRISDSETSIKTKIREGILNEMSIGYVVMDAKAGQVSGKDVYLLTEIKLYEISLVTIAANKLALIDSVKGDGESNHEYILNEFDRIIANEKNREKKFEIMLLKTLVSEILPQEKAESTEENNKPEVKKDFAILFDMNLFTNKLI